MGSEMCIRDRLRIKNFCFMRFDELDLEDEILDGLEDMNFHEMTPVQEHTIPVILEGRDIIGCAQTGTGKTAAYTLPLLNKLLIEVRNPYDTPPVMRDGVPVSDAAGHGFGCRSIQAIAQQRGGLCQFLAERGTFLLRVVLPAKGVAK